MGEATYAAQKYDAVRTVSAAEMRRAILIGTRVRIDNEGGYGYLYKGELYVSILKDET